MPDDTTAAMAHLRESCAIAAGKVAPPLQVTCWEYGGWYDCPACSAPCPVMTDGRKLWASCPLCETVPITA